MDMGQTAVRPHGPWTPEATGNQSFIPMSQGCCGLTHLCLSLDFRVSFQSTSSLRTQRGHQPSNIHDEVLTMKVTIRYVFLGKISWRNSVGHLARRTVAKGSIVHRIFRWGLGRGI